MKVNKIENVDEYIKNAPEQARELLAKMRETIRAAAGEAEERISYQIPTFILRGNLVHFAGFEKHIGLYPTPSAIAAFKKELSKYELSKGGVRFRIGQPVPWSTIKKIVRFRVKENLGKKMIG